MKAAAGLVIPVLLLLLAGCAARDPSAGNATSSTGLTSGEQHVRPIHGGPLQPDLYSIYLFQLNSSVPAAAEYVAEDRMYGNVTVEHGHVELRFGRGPSSEPSEKAYPVVMACTRWWDPNFEVDLPVTSVGRCQAPYEAGQYVVRAHAWGDQAGTHMDWWSQETTLTVA